MIERIAGAKIFSKINLREAYHLLRIKEGDEWKTAFGCRYGHFEYLVVPFGLTNAPAAFQAFMINDILRHLLDKGVTVYLDVILIYSKTQEEHDQLMLEVLKALSKNNCSAKLEKCFFSQDSVEFVGYIVSVDGLEMDPKKTKDIWDWPKPTTVKKVQS